MEILYLDGWFLLNLLCDYLLCLLTAYAAQLRLRRGRYLLAALLGAVYACAVFLPGLRFLAGPGWKLAVGALMGCIAFQPEHSPLRCMLLFFAVAACFGGALRLLSPEGPPALSLRALVFSFLLCYGLGLLLFRAKTLLHEEAPLTVTLGHRGRTAELRALRDTGNRLRDSVTGSKVLIVSPRALERLLPGEAALFSALDPVTLLECSRSLPALRSLRLLRYRAVGEKSGLLPVFRPEKVVIGGQERRDVLVGVSPEAEGDGYEGIF